jgi:hypothetical protein
MPPARCRSQIPASCKSRTALYPPSHKGRMDGQAAEVLPAQSPAVRLQRRPARTTHLTTMTTEVPADAVCPRRASPACRARRSCSPTQPLAHPTDSWLDPACRPTPSRRRHNQRVARYTTLEHQTVDDTRSARVAPPFERQLSSNCRRSGVRWLRSNGESCMSHSQTSGAMGNRTPCLTCKNRL